MTTVFVDLDGVICDFDNAYVKFCKFIDGDRVFHSLVEDYSIFEQLDPMPNYKKLIDLLTELDLDLCVLTSLGTQNRKIAAMGKTQKCNWLNSMGIPWPRAFVTSGIDKARYAKRGSILIDDRADNIDAFEEAGGIGVLYKDHEWVKMEYLIRCAVSRSRQLQFLDKQRKEQK